MIDTDKYENITPERWTVDEDDPYRVVDVQDCTIARTDWVVIYGERKWQLANTRLIADAPLLLEAYKRLREENELMVTYLRYMRDGELTDKDWLSVNELIGEEE